MRISIRTLSRFTCLAIVIVASNGCAGGVVDALLNSDTKPLPESHPSPTDDAASDVAPVWSANGAELGYVLPGHGSAVARAGGTGARRVLYTAPASHRIVSLELSADGAEWYTVTVGPDGKAAARRHREGFTEVLTDRGGDQLSGGAYQRRVVAAANGDIAYVVGYDSLFVRRGTAEAEFLSTGCGGIAAVAPAGEGVICFEPGSFPRISRFAKASAPTPISPSDPASSVVAVRWNAQGTYLVSGVLISHHVWEQHGAPQLRYETPKGGSQEFGGALHASLAADGKSFITSALYCSGPNLFSCSNSQQLVYYSDATARTTKRIVVHSTEDEFRLALSPDGRRVAYTTNGKLYLLNAN